MASRPIRIQLAEDHEIVRTGFRYLLDNEPDMDLVAESADGVQACRHYGEYKPDVLVMDISMPDMHGLEAIHRILLRDPGARILVLSMHSGVVAERTLQEGARGFICKRSAARELVVAIRRIMQGERYLDPESAEQLSPRMENASPPSLSNRELEICMHLVDGRSVASIAEQMHLSEKTVYTHREHIMRKLGVATVVELTKLASILGIQLACRFSPEISV
jgi:two-component system, NarL family, invasion response regulator UvrY